MRHAPSIVPLDRLDREIYLVLEDFGARAGCSWREADEQDTDVETIIRDLLSGQYAYPVRRSPSTPSRAGLAMPPARSQMSLPSVSRVARSRRPCRPSSKQMLPDLLLYNWRFLYGGPPEFNL